MKGIWQVSSREEKLAQAWGCCFSEICVWLLPRDLTSPGLCSEILRDVSSEVLSVLIQLLLEWATFQKGKKNRTHCRVKERKVRKPAICPWYSAHPGVLRGVEQAHGVWRFWWSCNGGSLSWRVNHPVLNFEVLCHSVLLKHIKKQKGQAHIAMLCRELVPFWVCFKNRLANFSSSESQINCHIPESFYILNFYISATKVSSVLSWPIHFHIAFYLQ